MCEGHYFWCEDCGKDSWTWGNCIYDGDGLRCTKCGTSYRVMFMRVTDTPLEAFKAMLENQIGGLADEIMHKAEYSEEVSRLTDIFKMFESVLTAVSSVVEQQSETPNPEAWDPTPTWTEVHT